MITKNRVPSFLLKSAFIIVTTSLVVGQSNKTLSQQAAQPSYVDLIRGITKEHLAHEYQADYNLAKVNSHNCEHQKRTPCYGSENLCATNNIFTQATCDLASKYSYEMKLVQLEFQRRGLEIPELQP